MRRDQMPIPIIFPEIDEVFRRQVRLAKKGRFPRQYGRCSPHAACGVAHGATPQAAEPLHRIDLMLDTILQAVGRTPLVKLNRLTEGLQAKVAVKVEAMNPGGSVKDRVALSM